MFGQLPEFPVQRRDEEGEVMVPVFDSVLLNKLEMFRVQTVKCFAPIFL